MMPRRMSRTVLVGLVLAAAIVVPFVLFGGSIERWAHAVLLDRRPPGLVPMALCALLLASDIVLPVPSSVVSTVAGMWWGPWLGTVVSTLGMTLGSLLGYLLGLRADALRRWVGAAESQHLGRLFARHGEWIVVILRPIPVLAEASAVFAGFSRMNAGRFLALSAVANACVSVFYAIAGAWIARRAPGAGMLLLLAVLTVIAISAVSARRAAPTAPE